MVIKWRILIIALMMGMCLPVRSHAVSGEVFLFQDKNREDRPIYKYDYQIYEKMYVHIKMKNYTANTPYQIRILNPSGKQVYSQDLVRDKDYRSFNQHRGISLGQFVGMGSGRWTVVLSLQGKDLSRKSFTLVDPGLHFDYLHYIPRSFKKGNGILVVVHGAGRSPGSVVGHVSHAKQIAEELGVILIAPYFSEEEYHGYQTVFPGEAYLKLQQYIREIADRYKADPGSISMWGHSGGGQFIHRYMMFFPENLVSVVPSGAGYYTFPDFTQNYSYGLKQTENIAPGVSLKINKMSHIRKTVLIGEKDILRTDDLNQSERADLQGLHRLERAIHWVNDMNRYFMLQGIDDYIHLEVVPDAGHGDTRNKSEDRILNYIRHTSSKPRVKGAMNILSRESIKEKSIYNIEFICQADAPPREIHIGLQWNQMSLIKKPEWRKGDHNIYQCNLNIELEGSQAQFIYTQIFTENDKSIELGDCLKP